MRYRYIFNGGVKPNSNISDYRFLDRQKLQGQSDALRVEIPDNAKLEKWECDEYSTWDRQNERDYELKELNPKICVKINGSWTILENATKEWLNGKDKRSSIKDSIKDKYSQTPIHNIGYVTDEQYAWWMKNAKYSWRFDKFPADLSNAKIPPLTFSELETLSFVREMFAQYYEEAIDESRFFKEYEKEDAKEFFSDLIKNISDDDLAYEWHQYSTTSLDPCKKFETKELVDKMKRSKYRYVYKDHYEYAIRNLVENISTIFSLHQLRKEKEENDDLER